MFCTSVQLYIEADRQGAKMKTVQFQKHFKGNDNFHISILMWACLFIYFQICLLERQNDKVQREKRVPLPDNSLLKLADQPGLGQAVASPSYVAGAHILGPSFIAFLGSLTSPSVGNTARLPVGGHVGCWHPNCGLTQRTSCPCSCTFQ